MTEFDRRAFLRGSGALGLGSLVGENGAMGAWSPAGGEPQTAAPPPAPFVWSAENLVFSFEFLDRRLRSRSLLPQGVAAGFTPPAPTEASGVETAMQCTGQNPPDEHGLKLMGGMPGGRLIFTGKRESATPSGRQLVLSYSDPVLSLKVESFYQSFHGVSAVRRWTRVTNLGRKSVGIEYLSSAMLYNFAAPRAFEEELRVHFAYNTWKAEGQWHAVRPSQIGFLDNGGFSLSGAFFDSIGTWSTQRYLPMGMVENTRLGVIWFWQIEHNGSWHWELSNTSAQEPYAYLGGPDALHAQAWKSLLPGRSYQTVPVGLGCVRGSFHEAVEALTLYRRAACLRARADNRNCPVIFNDFMNSLKGDPTTANEIPMIDAAAAAGCEYYVIDSGWHAELNEKWWDKAGAWEPSKTRFDGGLTHLLDYIRSKGMTPGLWIEPEVAGIHGPLAGKPDAWFFQRHGLRVIDYSRYQLDLRNPEVRAYLDAVFDRMVGQYGLGYIKLDYNIDALEGTDYRAESFGQGLLESNRALLAWLDGVLARYPHLTIENCAGGGARMEYGMLSHLQLQSSSDQQDYRRYPAIAVGATAGVLPEQLAVWSYPLSADGADEASFNMVNAMLVRIHMSGQLSTVSKESFAQVRAGIRVYKETIRPHIPAAIPFYPLGMPDITDPRSPVALGMRSPDKIFVAVWRLTGEAAVELPGIDPRMRLLYPTDLGIRAEPAGDGVRVTFPREHMACILIS